MPTFRWKKAAAEKQKRSNLLSTSFLVYVSGVLLSCTSCTTWSKSSSLSRCSPSASFSMSTYSRIRLEWTGTTLDLQGPFIHCLLSCYASLLRRQSWSLRRSRRPWVQILSSAPLIPALGCGRSRWILADHRVGLYEAFAGSRSYNNVLRLVALACEVKVVLDGMITAFIDRRKDDL